VPHVKAVRALSNKWAKLIAAVLAARTTYDEDIHVQHLLNNRVPWILDALPERKVSA
jgi:hypothetical protein